MRLLGSSALMLGVLAVVACAPVVEEPQPASEGETVALRDAGARVFKLEELTFPEINELDRERSVFFLAFGNLEEHGPHIPVGSDYYQAVGVRDRLIERLQAVHPDYNFVLVPVLPLGEGGANDVAHQFEHIGTFPVRYQTLRAVAMDLGSSIARKGFQNIFLIHGHGSGLHNVALNEAAAYVSERYQVRMVNITSLVFGGGFYSDQVITDHLGEGWQDEIGITGHSGTAETSANLYLHDLVKPGYTELEPFVVRDFAEIFRIHERSGWQGYWSDPSKATEAIGEDLIDDFVERSFVIAEMALAGEDLSDLPVYPDDMPPMPEVESFLAEVLQMYAEEETAIEAWLASRQASQ